MSTYDAKLITISEQLRNRLNSIIFFFFSVFFTKVVDIEEKLDILMKAYMQDRERFFALPILDSHSISYKSNLSAPPPPPPPSAGTASITATTNPLVNVRLLYFLFSSLECDEFLDFCI